MRGRTATSGFQLRACEGRIETNHPATSTTKTVQRMRALTTYLPLNPSHATPVKTMNRIPKTARDQPPPPPKQIARELHNVTREMHIAAAARRTARNHT